LRKGAFEAIPMMFGETHTQVLLRDAFGTRPRAIFYQQGFLRKTRLRTIDKLKRDSFGAQNPNGFLELHEPDAVHSDVNSDFLFFSQETEWWFIRNHQNFYNKFCPSKQKHSQRLRSGYFLRQEISAA
jgi:hypothetical protein